MTQPEPRSTVSDAVRKHKEFLFPAVANYYQEPIARARGDRKAEIDALTSAVAAEDTLDYSEPPLSISPVRENLGGALLRDGQNAEAEKVFREDLRRNPGSGRSMFGLMTALQALGKKDEASKVGSDYRKAWKYADITLTVEAL